MKAAVARTGWTLTPWRAIRQAYLNLPIGIKLMILVVQVLLLFSVITGLTSYSRLSNDVEGMLAQRLEHIARTGSMLLNPENQKEVIRSILRSAPNVTRSNAFIQEQRTLQQVRRMNGLATDIYTLYIDPARPNEMRFVTMNTDKTYAGNSMPTHPLVAQVIQHNRAIHSDLYQDENGSWISAFAPIRGKGGEVVSILEVDYSANEELQTLQERLIRDLVTSTVLGILLATILGREIGKSLTRPIRKLFDEFLLAAQGDLSARPVPERTDEIGGLNTAFNQMLEQLRSQKQSLADYSRNLESMVHDRTLALETANERIQSMMNSLGQGFFMFDSTGICLDLYSQACERLLGKKPAGRPIWEALRVEDPRSVARLETWVDLLFEADSDFEDVIALGPKTVPHPDGLYITLVYFPIREPESGRIRTLVVVATDQTEERNARARADREFAYSQAILRIVKNRSRFSEFTRDARVTFTRAAEEMAKPQIDIHTLFRLIHTFKSAASYFSLQDVASLAHEMESTLSKLRNDAADGKEIQIQDDFLQNLALLEVHFNNFLESNRDFIGSQSDTKQRLVELSTTELEKYHELLERKGVDTDTLRRFTETFLYEPIGRSFEFYDNVVGLEATRLEKEVVPIYFINGDMKIDADRFHALFTSMIHIFRNSVAHGIETPRERREAGKPSSGRITVEFSCLLPGGHLSAQTANAWIRITVTDDGRGVDPQKIRDRLKERGIQGWENESDAQVIQRIFEPGFSTALGVSDLAGRGVGLDAVKTEATALGGLTWVESIPGVGTSFIVEFPEEPARSNEFKEQIRAIG
jgi:two-component system chemotaxis sensor kinase CheA